MKSPAIWLIVLSALFIGELNAETVSDTTEIDKLWVNARYWDHSIPARFNVEKARLTVNVTRNLADADYYFGVYVDDKSPTPGPETRVGFTKWGNSLSRYSATNVSFHFTAEQLTLFKHRTILFVALLRETGGDTVSPLLKINSATLTLEGTFAAQTVVSERAMPAILSFLLSNEAPTISAASQTFIAPGQPFDIPISVSDSEGDQVTWEIQDVPAFAQVVETASSKKALRGLADASDVGDYEVTVVATDDGSNTQSQKTILLSVRWRWVVHRINAGGDTVDADVPWITDLSGIGAGYHNELTSNSQDACGDGITIDMSDPSVPDGTPSALFACERWDRLSGTEMSFHLPVEPGKYEVRLYFAEIYPGAQDQGARIFDVAIEGFNVLDNYDIYAKVGGYKAVVESFVIRTDGVIDIDFRREKENPAIKAIEISVVFDETPYINEAPIISATSQNFITLGQPFDIPISVSDPDGDQVTWEIQDVPAFAQVVDTAPGEKALRGTADASDIGEYEVTIVATDDSSKAQSRKTISLLVGILFIEDWEDGVADSSNWSLYTGTFNTLEPRLTLDNVSPAEGAYSFCFTAGKWDARDHVARLYHTFPNLQPSKISVWIKSGSAKGSDAYFVVRGDDTVTPPEVIAMIYFRAESSGGGLYIPHDAGGTLALSRYAADTWYLVEMRNIDWKAKTYEIWVDNVLRSASVPFWYARNAVTRIDIYNYHRSTACYDYIVLYF